MTDARENFDAAIVGAGPAGSSLAIRLARAGLKVLIAEKSDFPREKLCGEFVSPECLDLLSDLGVFPTVGSEIRKTVFYSLSGRSVEVESEWFGGTAGSALGLSRALLDSILLDRCLSVGVEVRTKTTAAAMINDGGGLSGIRLKGFDGPEAQVTARIYIDATGRQRVLARKFVASGATTQPAKHVAFKTHLRGAAIEDRTCEIYSYPGGYGGCNAVENGLSNLCFIVSADQVKANASIAENIVRNVVFRNNRAGNVLEHAVAEKEWLAVPIERFGTASVVPCEGLITVGDAAAFIDPFTGSGILMALESSAIAADAITRGFSAGFDFNAVASAYLSGHQDRFRTRLRVCSVLRSAAFSPTAAAALIQALRLSGGIRKRIAVATRRQ